MATEFRLEQNELRCNAGPARRLADDDRKRLEEAVRRYRFLVGRAAEDELRQLGNDLAVWLNGPDGWLTAAVKSSERPLVLEFSVPFLPETSLDRAFLAAPWELLVLNNEFLADRAQLQFSPVRRLGPRGTPPGPSRFQPGVLFMAAAPTDQHTLDFDAEERLIAGATRGRRLDLLVEESGTLEGLADAQQHWVDAAASGQDAPPEVIHLSCHGTAQGEPALALEDDFGRTRRVTAPELLAALSNRPRLLVLAACESGAAATGGAALLDSLASALVQSGFPAVLGWDGGVLDPEASLYAGELYDQLAHSRPLEEAVTFARAALRTTTFAGRPARDWHRARLLLGPDGGGILCRGKSARLPNPQITARAFLDDERQVEVASPAQFVGRRREIQRALRILRRREGPPTGALLLHGLGRQGKSSLAARLVHRLPGHHPVVLYGKQCRARPLLERLSAALGGVKGFAAWNEEWRERVIQDEGKREQGIQPEGNLEFALRALLGGICREAAPLLFILDDFEQCLVEPCGGGPHTVEPARGGPHTVAAAYVPTLRALRAAVAESDTRSALLLTSRYEFSLPTGLAPDLLQTLSLPAMTEDEGRRQLQALAAGAGGRRASAAAEPDDTRRQREAAEARRRARMVTAAAGHPFLLKLLFETAARDPAAGESLLAALEAFHRTGALPPDAGALRTALENLALDHLLDLLPGGEAALVRLSLLFPTPLPRAVPEALAREFGLVSPLGGPGARATALGLWVRVPDLVQPGEFAGGLHPLVRPHVRRRLGDLRRADAAEAARVILPALAAAWGGPDAAPAWPHAAAAACLRLALWARDAAWVARLAERVVRREQQEHRIVAARRWGRQALRALDRAGAPAPVGLLSITAQLAAGAGAGARADHLFERALAVLECSGAAGEALRVVDSAELLLAGGRRAEQRGELETAETRYALAAQQLRAAGMERETAVALGHRADIREARGDLDEALRIRQEEELPVYERLQDVRSRAITWGKIADILQARGDLDEALRIRQAEELPVYERLGDRLAWAVGRRKVADILNAQGELDLALDIYRNECLPVAQQIGAVRDAAVFWGLIADILQARGDLNEALRIRQEEQLPVFERLQDVRELLVGRANLAITLFQRSAPGDREEAARLLRLALAAAEPMWLPEAAQIRGLMRQMGMAP